VARLAARIPLRALTNAFRQNPIREAKKTAPAAALSAAGLQQSHSSQHGKHP